MTDIISDAALTMPSSEEGDISVERVLGTIEDGKINEIRKIDDSEYEEIVKARKALAALSRDQQLFLIVVANYDDYNKFLGNLMEAYKKNQSMSWIGMENIIIEINRHMLNLLSSIRTFLDHSETNLKRHYGKDSDRFLRFKKSCSDAYDNVFSYRFVYNLRSYAQHCGMPVGNIDINSEVIAPEFKDESHQILVQFNRDELLTNYDWKKLLRDEIQKLPERFDVNAHLVEMMNCLKKINLLLIEDRLAEAVKGAKYIEELVSGIKEKTVTPCIMRMKKQDEKNLNVEIEWLPLHIVALFSTSNIYQAK